MANRPSVTVLDDERRFLEYTHPAMARRLLKDGSASIWSKAPFAIILHKVVKQPNYQGSNNMVPNYTQFFKEEREIYVQNVADAQVTVTFEVATGHVESYLFPHSPDPVNLTNHFPFAIVKNSMDLRKMLQRKPAALKLLSEDEYRMYYAQRAKAAGLTTTDAKGKKVPDVDGAIIRAEEERQGILQRMPITDEQPKPIKQLKTEGDDVDGDEDGPVPARGRNILQEDLLDPRILHLCNQVKHELTDQEKMPANQMLEELHRLEPRLKATDWEHVANHGHYKSVKNYAKKKITAMSAAE